MFDSFFCDVVRVCMCVCGGGGGGGHYSSRTRQWCSWSAHSQWFPCRRWWGWENSHRSLFWLPSLSFFSFSLKVMKTLLWSFSFAIWANGNPKIYICGSLLSLLFMLTQLWRLPLLRNHGNVKRKTPRKCFHDFQGKKMREQSVERTMSNVPSFP